MNAAGASHSRGQRALKYELLLLLVSLIWGSAFVAQQFGMEKGLGPLTFNGLRFALGCLSLIPVMVWRQKNLAPADGEVKLPYVGCLGAGLFLFAATSLAFEQCDSVTPILAAGTSFLQDHTKQWLGPHPHAAVTKRVNAAARQGVATLQARQVEDHQSLFRRFSLDVGATAPDLLAKTTLARLEAYAKGTTADPDLEALCHEPFINYVTSIREVSAKNTRREYGKVRGWTVQTMNNACGVSFWKWNPPGSAWYAQHLWEHFAFGRDLSYLRKTAYSVLKEVCQFWDDHLILRPDGSLVTPDGWSPEHGPAEQGVTYDQEIIFDLFTNTIEAADRVVTDGQKTYCTPSVKVCNVTGGRAGLWLFQIGDRQEFGNFELSRTPFAPAQLPATGQVHRVAADEFKAPNVPSPQDWVLVLEKVKEN